MKTKKQAETSLKVARQKAAETIIGLQDGTVSPLVADAIYKQSITIVDSYRVELRAIELAIQSNAGIDFNAASKLIDNKEVKVITPGEK